MSIQILLNDKIKQYFIDNPDLNELKENKFEIAVSNILNIKYLNGLDIEELINGIIGGGGDEGIDSLYLFHNDEIIQDIELTQITKASRIRLEIVQAKDKASFSVDGFRKLIEGVEEIFNLDQSTFKKIGANEMLVEKAKLIQEVFRKAKIVNSEFKLRLHYASRGDVKKVPNKINLLEDEFKQNLKYVDEDIQVILHGAQELLDLSNKVDDQLEIIFDERPLDLSEENAEIKGFAGFVRGESLIRSLLDENRRFRDELTEGNIRYFLGENININESIIETASSEHKSKNFWAMNNGITILGERVDATTKNHMIIDNPQIVNGCQTVHCLYEAYLKKGSYIPNSLQIFVKLIETTDNEVQQDIITATNSQNTVQTDSLKANESIQKNIEKFLLKKEIYYERRRNYYKRKGKKGLRVFSLRKMAQIMHTVFRKEAIRAVNHTKDLFISEQYKKIFNQDADYDSYLFACKLYQKIWNLKKQELREKSFSPEIKELKSKSLFCLLHICSSLLFKFASTIDIAQPEKNNKFTKVKSSAFKYLDDEKKLQKIYKTASAIFLKCANSYGVKTKKVKNTLFKNRSFDKEYIMPAVKKHLRS